MQVCVYNSLCVGHWCINIIYASDVRKTQTKLIYQPGHHHHKNIENDLQLQVICVKIKFFNGKNLNIFFLVSESPWRRLLGTHIIEYNNKNWIVRKLISSRFQFKNKIWNYICFFSAIHDIPIRMVWEIL